MLMKRVVWGVAALLLGGCATTQIGPQDRNAWQAVHTHVLKGVDERQVLDASEKLLKLADHDFTFDYPPHQLIGDRKWSVFLVIAATSGSDHWRLTTRDVPDGVELTVEISRQIGMMGPQPTVGVAGPGAGGMGMGVGSTTLPGESVQGEFPYQLFWSRLDYLLGKSQTWTTCKQAEAAWVGRKYNSDVLCAVHTDDNAPTK